MSLEFSRQWCFNKQCPFVYDSFITFVDVYRFLFPDQFISAVQVCYPIVCNSRYKCVTILLYPSQIRFYSSSPLPSEESPSSGTPHGFLNFGSTFQRLRPPTGLPPTYDLFSGVFLYTENGRNDDFLRCQLPKKEEVDTKGLEDVIMELVFNKY